LLLIDVDVNEMFLFWARGVMFYVGLLIWMFSEAFFVIA
jgi:hypothetical protein